jgi:hypothetical protein
MTACAGYERLYAWLGTRNVATSRETTRHWVLSMCAQLYEYPLCVLPPGRLHSGDIENGMSCALRFLATCPKIQPRSTG